MKKERRKKFKRGHRIWTIQEVVEAHRCGDWLYWRNVPKHPEVFISMTVWTLLGAIVAGNIYAAIDTGESE